MPWGFVAGKWYGPENVRPILMLHGWQDNAGSFDTLIPLLSPEFSYLAIDLPGHGLSSRLPHGILYTVINYIHTLNHIQRHYKWDKLSFCAHSMGAAVATLYASMYPDRCDLLICLDAIMKPYHGSIENHIRLLQKYSDGLFTLDEMSQSDAEPPTYTHEELIGRWAKQANITHEGIEYLTKRGVLQSKKDSNRFYYSRDIRLKILDFGRFSISDDIHYKLIQRITAPHLFIKAGKSTAYEGTEGVHRAVDILRTTNPKFEWFTIDAGHHNHLTDPMLIKDHILKFINKYRTADSH